MELLGKRLKWLRERNRYPQKEIADKIGMSLNGYQKIEYFERDPKLDVLIQLAKMYNVTTDFLLGLTDETAELKELAFKARNLFNESDKLGSIGHEQRVRVNHLREEMYELQSAVKHFNHIIDYEKHSDKTEIKATQFKKEKTLHRIEIIESRIRDYESVLQEMNHKSFEFARDYAIAVLEYIQLMLDIPKSKAGNSSFLKKHFPIKTSIQENLFDTYSISIRGQYFSTYMGDYKTVEEAEREKIRIDEFFDIGDNNEKLSRLD